MKKIILTIGGLLFAYCAFRYSVGANSEALDNLTIISAIIMAIGVVF